MIRNGLEIADAWRRRQAAMIAICQRGSFAEALQHSPDEYDAFHDAEEEIATCPATDVDGVISKLWVAVSHCGVCDTATDRKNDEHLKLTNPAALSDANLTFEARAILSAIAGLSVVKAKGPNKMSDDIHRALRAARP